MGTIAVSFNGTDVALIRAITERAELLTGGIITTLDEEDAELVAYIVGSELHGQILNQVTGKLAGSIRFLAAVQEGSTVVGVVEGGGGPAWYAIIWEKTGHKAFDVEPVTAQALRFVIEGEVLFRRRVHIPEEGPRPFMGPALDANRTKILVHLQSTINEIIGA
jgi:hypothetical protein